MRLRLNSLVPMVVAGAIALVIATPSTAHHKPMEKGWWKGESLYVREAGQKKIIKHIKLQIKDLKKNPIVLMKDGQKQTSAPLIPKQKKRLQVLKRELNETQNAIASAVVSSISLSSSSGGYYSCGLQFDPMWMSGNAGNPIPICGNRESQIAAAEWIAENSINDPWPNCPDPYDGGGSWDDTARCENGGKW